MDFALLKHDSAWYNIEKKGSWSCKKYGIIVNNNGRACIDVIQNILRNINDLFSIKTQ